jgi:RNA polymerase sigma-70 factor (ECF subfamily)
VRQPRSGSESPDERDAADRERFEALFGRYYGAVLRYAVRRVGVDTAGEIVSETFLTAWRRLADVPDNALPWLYGTARRIVANEVRRRDRSLRLGQRLANERPAIAGDDAGLLDEALRVQAAIEALGRRDQEVVRLAAWEQLGPADAAAVLGCTTGAYKVRLHRARRRLAVLLAEPDAAPTELIGNGERQ